MGKMVLQDLQGHVPQILVRQGADQTFPAGSAVSRQEGAEDVRVAPGLAEQVQTPLRRGIGGCPLRSGSGWRTF
mgnify:CR=1 FL=1